MSNWFLVFLKYNYKWMSICMCIYYEDITHLKFLFSFSRRKFAKIIYYKHLRIQKYKLYNVETFSVRAFIVIKLLDTIKYT